MKKSIIFLFFFLITQSFFAQNETFSREKMDAYKKLFLTDKLKLDSNTEAAFWGAYKSYEDSLYKLYDNHRSNFRKLSLENNNTTIEEYDQQIDNYMSYEKKKVELKGRLITELKEVMSFRKTYMLFQYEDEFRREMMKKLRESRKGNKN
tara:strand:- start:2163 stop:2612 length:450 start_codon:yes stop_codon:yes gene_type:complete